LYLLVMLVAETYLGVGDMCNALKMGLKLGSL